MLGKSFRRVCKRRCKACAVWILKRLPPFPTWFWDGFVKMRLGNEPEVPEVLFVQDLNLDAPEVRIPLQELPQQDEGFLRVAIISDTHENHKSVMVPEADVLLHCGDILLSSTLAKPERSKRVLQDFNSWLGKLPCGEKVVIGGNHDVALELLGTEATEVLHNATLLQDSSVVLPIAGIKVYGNGWSRGHSHNQSLQSAKPVISDACEGAHVVMTHGCNETIEEVVLRKAQPCLWASGHYHERHGVRKHNGVLFANAAILDGNDNPHQPPVVVDLPKPSTAVIKQVCE